MTEKVKMCSATYELIEYEVRQAEAEANRLQRRADEGYALAKLRRDRLEGVSKTDED